MKAKPKICFVSSNYYKILNINKHQSIGGAELQESLIIKELQARGYGISVVTSAHGMPDRYVQDGLTIHSTYTLGEGIPVLRFFYPNLFKFFNALLKTDADIYYIRTASYYLMPLIIFAKILKKKNVIYSGASDVDFNPERIPVPTYRDKIMFLWGLRRVNAVVVQSGQQRRLLSDHFGKNGYQIPNGLNKKDKQPILTRKTILWVGMIRPVKRPEIFLWLAGQHPQWQFIMIGGPVDGCEDYYQRLRTMSKQLPNLLFKGFVDYDETERFFSSAKVFINTSEREGFPNTFLQAWACGLPVISFCDPDNAIASKNLGVVVKNSQEMDQALSRIMNNEVVFDEADIAACFQRNFSIEKIVDAYEKLFTGLISFQMS